MLTRNAIHILGAAGSGTSTLGAALAEATGLRHFDADAYYWIPSDPPFLSKRKPPERLRLLHADLDSSPDGWILSGSLCSWGDTLVSRFQLAVFLTLSAELRLQRLRDRERARYGAHRLTAGGDLHGHHVEFMEWAAQYDTGGLEVRSRLMHETWLKTLSCPVLRLSSVLSVGELCAAVTQAAV